MDNEQQDAIKMAKEGHSFLLTGQAGSGKSWTVSKIVDALRKEGKMVEITATTGRYFTAHKKYDIENAGLELKLSPYINPQKLSHKDKNARKHIK